MCECNGEPAQLWGKGQEHAGCLRTWSGAGASGRSWVKVTDWQGRRSSSCCDRLGRCHWQLWPGHAERLYEQVPLSDWAVFKVSTDLCLTWVEGGDKLHSVGKIVWVSGAGSETGGLPGWWAEHGNGATGRWWHSGCRMTRCRFSASSWWLQGVFRMGKPAKEIALHSKPA